MAHLVGVGPRRPAAGGGPGTPVGREKTDGRTDGPVGRGHQCLQGIGGNTDRRCHRRRILADEERRLSAVLHDRHGPDRRIPLRGRAPAPDRGDAHDRFRPPRRRRRRNVQGTVPKEGPDARATGHPASAHPGAVYPHHRVRDGKQHLPHHLSRSRGAGKTPAGRVNRQGRSGGGYELPDRTGPAGAGCAGGGGGRGGRPGDHPPLGGTDDRQGRRETAGPGRHPRPRPPRGAGCAGTADLFSRQSSLVRVRRRRHGGSRRPGRGGNPHRCVPGVRQDAETGKPAEGAALRPAGAVAHRPHVRHAVRHLPRPLPDFPRPAGDNRKAAHHRAPDRRQRPRGLRRGDALRTGGVPPGIRVPPRKGGAAAGGRRRGPARLRPPPAAAGRTGNRRPEGRGRADDEGGRTQKRRPLSGHVAPGLLPGHQRRARAGRPPRARKRLGQDQRRQGPLVHGGR